jgi:hypothetical protein
MLNGISMNTKLRKMIPGSYFKDHYLDYSDENKKTSTNVNKNLGGKLSRSQN